MRVLIDARMAEGNGGVQQWVIGLAAALSKLDDGSEEYRFLVNEGHGEWLSPYLAGHCRMLVNPTGSIARPGVRVPAAGPAPTGLLHRLRAVVGARLPVLPKIWRRVARPSRRVARSAFDLTVLRAATAVVHFPMQSASVTSVPSIYQPWDLQHRHLPEFFSAGALKDRDVTYRRYCAQAALIIVPTTWVKADLVTEYGIAPERIAVVHPPPPTRVYMVPTPEEADAIATRLGLPPRFAFYPALAWPHKNHERLLDALALLRERGIEVPLVCSGARNDRHPALLRRAEELGIGAQVMFPGFLTAAEIQVVYRRATMLVFPSLFEGGSFPIIEAFAAGLPVACSNVTSLPALVGDAAIVFDPTDPAAIAAAVERLWFDDAYRADLVERGRARVLQFDWSRTALLMRAYYRLVAGRRLDSRDAALVAAEPLV